MCVALAMCATGQPLTQGELGWGGVSSSSGRSNFDPIARDQFILMTQNTSVSTTLYGFDETIPWYFSTSSVPASGVLSGFNTNTGAITYTPTNGFLGTDTYNYVVHETDGSLTATGNVFITVIDSNTLATACFTNTVDTGTADFYGFSTVEEGGLLIGTTVNGVLQFLFNSVPFYTNFIASGAIVLCSTSSVSCFGFNDNITNATATMPPVGSFLIPSGNTITYNYDGTTNGTTTSKGPDTTSFVYCNTNGGKALRIRGAVTYIRDTLSPSNYMSMTLISPSSVAITQNSLTSVTNQAIDVVVPLNDFQTNTVSLVTRLINEPRVFSPFSPGLLKFRVTLTNTIQ